MSTLSVIKNNPYRLLGVYSNSPLKNRVANKNRLKAFIRVGKNTPFPTDFETLLGKLNRSLEDISQAESRINLPEDQLQNAFFWFINASPIDSAALANLEKGNIDKSIEILEKRETFSSLVNLGVIAFSQGDVDEGIWQLTKVIHGDIYRGQFVNAICGEKFEIEEEDLAHLFIDALSQDVDLTTLKESFSENGPSLEDDDYILDKLISVSVKKIESAIAVAKSTDEDDAQAQYDAGIRLMQDTRSSVEQLRSLLDGEDIRLQNQLDAVAKQILECAIGYYNNTKDEKSYDKALFLGQYAKNLAVGETLQKRCNDNIKTFKIAKEEDAYAEQIGSIRRSLNVALQAPKQTENVRTLLSNVQQPLAELASKAGISSPIYLTWSSVIVSLALGILIDVVNEAQSNCTPEAFRTGRILNLVNDTLVLMHHLETYKMDQGTWDRFSKNLTTLQKIQCDVTAITQRAQPTLFDYCIRYWWIIVILLIVILN